MSTVITHWCKQRGLAAADNPQASHRAVVVDNVRVCLGELPSGALVVESKIAVLPLADRERDALVDKASRLAVGRICHSRARLVADAGATALWLQVVLPGTSGDEQLSLAVEDLVNEVERWRKVM